MTRLAALLVLLPLAGAWLKIAQPADSGFDRAQGIQLAEQVLISNGLHQDLSSDISISGHKAAVVVGPRQGCKGALIVAPLPPTAQSFETVVAGFEDTATYEGFIYRGEHSETYPYLSVTLHRIRNALYLTDPESNAWGNTVFAYRELGPCNLAQNVTWSFETQKENSL